LDFHILGVKTNIAYMVDVLAHAEFESGAIDTGFLGREFAEWKISDEIPAELWDISESATQSTSSAGKAKELVGAWTLNDGYRVHKTR
jgi:acetyl/propionyl-CoA carboxylase alpha subunit